MWHLTLRILLLILVFPLSASTQITFERTYGGSSLDHGLSVSQTLEGGYIIAGCTGPCGDYPYVIKTDAFGDTLWTRTFDIPARVYAGLSVSPTTDMGYVLAALYWCCPREARILVIKMDSLGTPQWERTYGKGQKRHSWGTHIQQTSDGAYILTGGAGLDPYLVRMDSLGNRVWERTYSFGHESISRCVQQTPDGGYVIAGGRWNVFLIKTDSLGDTVWARAYGGTERDEGYCVQLTSDGGYIVSGSTASFATVTRDVYLIKTDSEGNAIWTKTYGGSLIEKGYAVQQTIDGGYIIVGPTNSYGAGEADVYLIKTDFEGNVVWTRTYGGSLGDKAFSVQQTSDGGYIIAGYTESYAAGHADVYLIKTDSKGLVKKRLDETHGGGHTGSDSRK